MAHSGGIGFPQHEAVKIALFESSQINPLVIPCRFDKTEDVDVELPRPVKIGNPEFEMCCTRNAKGHGFSK
jgi:hypothetical protein